MSEECIVGTVKWFNKDKGYGFIELPGGGADIFVHANQLKKSGIHRELRDGEKIKFLTSKGPKGSYATDLKFDGVEEGRPGK